jgi:hypothetical protein
LRGIGLSRGGKFAKVHSLFGDRPVGDQRVELGGASLFIELRTDEDAGHLEVRSQELVHRTNSFGDKELLTLSCFPPTQIAGNR